MPLNVRRFCTSVLLVLITTIFTLAQTTSDVMRARISKAKAFIAIKNYNAAIYELENIRRETNDQAVHGVINVLLMSSYLEQGEYKRAQDFLTELSNLKKAGKQAASASYFAVGGQVVKSARTRLERYRSLGLNVSDRNLPKEAVADLDKMRETLETVVEQSKIIGKDTKQTSNATALLEEASAARGSLARDDFDANRWKTENADAREMMIASRSVVVNAVNDQQTTEESAPQTNTLASNSTQTNTVANNPVQPNVIKTSENPVSLQPVPNSANTGQTIAETPKPDIKKPVENNTIASENTQTPNLPVRSRRVENEEAQNKIQTQAIANNASADNTVTNGGDSMLEIGSLIAFATEKVNPVYPQMARNMRTTGVVKVELVIDENGQVAQVQNASGPAMLQSAAKDAVKRWKFRPFTRDGQPVRASGFVSFNFSL